MELLRREFSELKTVMADQLMYVKEDLILPHHYTFYDFIVTKVCNIDLKIVKIKLNEVHQIKSNVILKF